jgi:hypothetical protein
MPNVASFWWFLTTTTFPFLPLSRNASKALPNRFLQTSLPVPKISIFTECSN